MTQIGDILDQRYEILEKLSSPRPVASSPATASSWLVREVKTGEQWFCKSYSLQQEGWERYHQLELQAEILQQLDHEAIPRFRELLVVESLAMVCFLREWIPGQDLETLLQSRRFSEQDVVELAKPLLMTLQSLHNLSPRVLHRNLKPSSILIREDQPPVLLNLVPAPDAFLLNSSLTLSGNYGYTPPEQFLGKADPSSDLYALGATLIYLLSRVHPSELPHKEGRLLFHDAIHVRPSLLPWLQRLVEPSPANRFATAEQALRGLEMALQELGTKGQTTKSDALSDKGGLLRPITYDWQWEHAPEKANSLHGLYAPVGSRFQPLLKALETEWKQSVLTEHNTLQEVALFLLASQNHSNPPLASLLLRTLHPMDAADALFALQAPQDVLLETGPVLAEKFSMLWTKTPNNSMGQWLLLYFLKKHHWTPEEFWKRPQDKQLAFLELESIPGGQWSRARMELERFSRLPLGKQAEQFARFQSVSTVATQWFEALFTVRPDAMKRLLAGERDWFETEELPTYPSTLQNVWQSSGGLGSMFSKLLRFGWFRKQEDLMEKVGRLAGSVYSLAREVDSRKSELLEEYHWLLEK